MATLSYRSRKFRRLIRFKCVDGERWSLPTTQLQLDWLIKFNVESNVGGIQIEIRKRAKQAIETFFAINHRRESRLELEVARVKRGNVAHLCVSSHDA